MQIKVGVDWVEGRCLEQDAKCLVLLKKAATDYLSEG